MTQEALPCIGRSNSPEIIIPSPDTDCSWGIGLGENCPNAVVVTPAGSSAEKMALEQGLQVRNE